MRNGTVGAFRIAVAVLAACNPASSRPAFSPYPEAVTAVLSARPDRVTAEVQQWLAAEKLPVQWTSTRDGYVETAWLASGVKIRCWADPDAPGRARLTVEAVYRPLYDPSRIPRDLERPAPEGHGGSDLARRLRDAMQAKFPLQ